MQRLKKLMFAVLISVMCLSSVNAARSCSTSEKAELNKILPNIKANYEEKQKVPVVNENESEEGGFTDGGAEEQVEGGIYEEQIQYYFDIVVTNLTEQFYLEISNSSDDEVKTFNYSDSKDGIVTYSWEYLDEVTTFTIKVFTSDKTGCPGTLQKTLTIRTPRFNEYYDSPSCKEVPEFNLCQKYVTYGSMENAEFERRIEEYINSKNIIKENPEKEEQEKATWEKIKEFVSNNKYYFIGGGVVLVVGAGVVIGLVVKKRRSNEL